MPSSSLHGQRGGRRPRPGPPVEAAAAGTLLVTVFTLVICLVVVALSGAAVLHITLVDPTKRATPRYDQPRDPRVPTPPPATGTTVPEVRPGSESSADVRQEPEVRHPPEVEDPPEPVGGAVVHGAPEAHRARSAGLLVLLLTSIGGVLAVAVAVAAVAAAAALRAALMG